MRIFFSCIFCFLAVGFAIGQVETQTIKGQVIDKDTREPLIGANVILLKSAPIVGVQTDENGQFLLPNIAIGRRAVQISFVGYATFTSEEFILNSVKESVLNIELKESSALSEVVVTASNNTNSSMNDLAVVSARSFSVEETERIPTAANDPGRMAMVYPGVAQGRDDSENQIIIRGNSPFGILWRLEGVDIPNPNHFALPGSSGGGITVFSAQLLNRSDFFTGGMPAEYGNCMTGAFDIHFRKGNMDNREYRVKAGILGLDFATEGPIVKGRSSYLVNYRYSTLGLLNYMGVYLVGPRVINAFQDLSFNIVTHSKDNKKTFTVFGLGGLSLQHNQPVADPLERDPTNPRDVQEWLRPSNMGTIGMTYTAPVGERGYIKWVAAGIGSFIGRTYDTLDVADVRYNYQSARYRDTRLTSSLTYHVKWGEKTRFKAGITANFIAFEANKTAAPRASLSDITAMQSKYGLIFDDKGKTQTAQAFASINREFGDKLSISAGFHALYLALNGTKSLDPRAAMKYRLAKNQTVSLAVGQYSQMMALPVYSLRDQINVTTFVNRDLEMPRAWHYIVGYQFVTKSFWKFGIEGYLQQLSHLPVGNNGFAMLNYQENFPEEDMSSVGLGRNMGIDMTVEKFFANRFYLLATGSVFDSKYRALDNVWYNSAFDDQFSAALTVGREWVRNSGNVLQTGIRFMYNGGFTYTPNDAVKSAASGEYAPLEGAYYSERTPNYFRPDARISYRINKAKTAWVLSLDLQNVANYINYETVGFDANTNKINITRNGDTLVPIFSAQLDF